MFRINSRCTTVTRLGQGRHSIVIYLLGCTCFSDAHREGLLQAVKGRRTIADLMDSCLKTSVETVTEAVEAEKAAKEEAKKEQAVALAAIRQMAETGPGSADDPAIAAGAGTVLSEFDEKLVDIEDEATKGKLLDMVRLLQKHGSKIKVARIWSLDTDEKLALLAAWEKALVKVKTWVTLVNEHGLSDTSLLKTFQDSPTARCAVKFNDQRDSRFLLWWIDLKLTGEAASQPHVRVTPFKADHIRRLLSVALQAGMGEQDAQLNAAHLFGFMEGFKTVEAQLSNFFSSDDHATQKPVRLQKDKRIMTIAYSEDSLKARRFTARGYISQFERMIFYSGHAIEVGRHIPVKDRTRFSGSNVGDLLGFVQMVTPGSTEQWKETFFKKKQMLGTKREDVGSKGTGPSGGESLTPRVRQNDDMEPVCYWSTPKEVHLTLLDGEYPIAAVNDLAVGDGVFAYCCIVKKIPYLGLTWSETHRASC